MKNIFAIFLILWSSIASAAPIQIQNRLETSWFEAARLYAPGRQFTKIGDKQYLIETGNQNLIENENFQAAPNCWKGWTLSAGVTAADDTSIKEVPHTKSCKLTITAVNGLIAEYNFSANGRLQAKQYDLLLRLLNTSLANLQVCAADENGTNSSSCKTVVTSTEFSDYLAQNIYKSSNTNLRLQLRSTVSVTGTVNLQSASAKPSAIFLFNPIGPWQNWTPTFAGFNSPSAIDLQWMQLGPNIAIRGKFSVTSGAASIASITLPNGLLAAKTELQCTYYRTVSSTNKGGTMQITAGSNVVTFSTVDIIGINAASATTPGNGNAIAGSNDTVYIETCIFPIQGWEGSVNSVPASQANYDWTPANISTTQAGWGTITISNAMSCRHRRDNADLLYDCRFTAGTVAASQAQFLLPNGLVVDSARVPQTAVAEGYWVRAVAAGTSDKTGTVLITGGNGYLQFSSTSYNSALDPLTPQNANAIATTGNVIHFFARVPIQGWQPNGGASLSAGMITSPSTTNNFRRIISNVRGSGTNNTCSSSPCTLANNTGFASVTRGGTGQYSVNFNQPFNAEPTCGVSGLGNTAGNSFPTVYINNAGTIPSSGGFGVSCFAGTQQDCSFSVWCEGI